MPTEPVARGRLSLNGARGAALLVGAVYCFARGVAYFPILGDVPSSLPAGLELISSVISLEVWAGAWVLIGVKCLIRAFSPNDALAWGLLTAIMTAWGVAYGFGWITATLAGQPSREWLNMTTYLCPAIIIAILSIWRASKSRPARADE